jgi:uncharacterized protein (TIGR03435 family)
MRRVGSGFVVLCAVLLAALLGVCGIALAQTSAPLPKFEVASIRPAKPNARGSRLWLPPGRFTANNVTTKMLIEFAYNYKRPGIALKDDQILGAPKWISSDRFDIDAKVEDLLVEQEEKKLLFNQWADQIRLMVQAMLADRFKLKVSQETKELPIYVLVIAKHGPKLTKSTVQPPGPLGARPPGSGPRRGPMIRISNGELTAVGVLGSDLASAISDLPGIGGRKVVDQTGLQGRYDFTLKWTPERGRMFGGPGPGGPAGAGGAVTAGQGAPSPAGAGGAQSAAGTPVAPDSSGPSIFTAVQQQLGLRLKPEKGPVEVLVIDHIEPPTPN